MIFPMWMLNAKFKRFINEVHYADEEKPYRCLDDGKLRGI